MKFWGDGGILSFVASPYLFRTGTPWTPQLVARRVVRWFPPVVMMPTKITPE